jgi:hypothetical protein
LLSYTVKIRVNSYETARQFSKWWNHFILLLRQAKIRESSGLIDIIYRPPLLTAWKTTGCGIRHICHALAV